MSDTAPASTPAASPRRDPETGLIVWLGTITTVLVVVTVLCIQGLYFYFQAREQEKKERDFPATFETMDEQRASLSNSSWMDHDTLQLDIRYARQLAVEDMQAAQKALADRNGED
jgi:hypothetical protein